MKEESTQKKDKRTLQGTVLSKSSSKTAVVEVSRFVKHPRVGKYMTIRKKYKVHDPADSAVVGAKVEIIESKPISKDKHFVLAAE